MRRGRRAIVGILALALVVTLAIIFWPKRTSTSEKGPRLVWSFEAPQPGMIVGAPAIGPDTVYLATIHTRKSVMRGVVYGIDVDSGKPRWVYDRDGAMLATSSTPLVAGESLYVGEGLHNNFACQFQCLDARTGLAKWTFPTGDHIEGGSALADRFVLFAAGNDGVYALDAESGIPMWSFRADLHIDSTPFVANGRVYAGSGKSRKFPTSQVVCIDLKSGEPRWRSPVNLPAWGSPVVAGDRVFAGLGNGRLHQEVEPPEKPAGALACFDSTTGGERWTFPVADAVFGRPAVAGERVVFGSRDGNLYGLSFDGEERYRLAMGGPVMAPPLAHDGLVYAVAVSGRVSCVRAEDGHELWRYELSQRGATPKVFAGPQISGRRLFVAGEMMAGQTGVVTLHCFELPENSQP